MGQNPAIDDKALEEESAISIDISPGTTEQSDELSLSCQQLIRFYQHPAKMFAQQQLNLHFDNNNTLLEDVEPFSVNHLQSYLLRQDLLSAALSISSNKDKSEQVLNRAQLSGKFPDLPTTTTLFNDYQHDVQQFSDEISKLDCDNPEPSRL